MAEVTCPHCGELILNEPSLVGQEINCPHCAELVRMPAFPTLPERLERYAENRVRRLVRTLACLGVLAIAFIVAGGGVVVAVYSGWLAPPGYEWEHLIVKNYLRQNPPEGGSVIYTHWESTQH